MFFIVKLDCVIVMINSFEKDKLDKMLFVNFIF